MRGKQNSPVVRKMTGRALGGLTIAGRGLARGWSDGEGASLSRLGLFGLSGRGRLVVAETLCLRRQFRVLQRSNARPRTHNRDRPFWICASRWFAGWRNFASYCEARDSSEGGIGGVGVRIGLGDQIGLE
jgi:hypothetical protein